MEKRHELNDEILVEEFYTVWNNGVEFLEKFNDVALVDEKMAQLLLAKNQFTQARHLCSSPHNIQACNLQLALIFDKIIETYAHKFRVNMQLPLEAFAEFIRLHLLELSELLGHGISSDASEVLAKLHNNIGGIYFELIDEFDAMGLETIESLGNKAKAHFETAISYTQNLLEIKKYQHMIARVNFDVASLIKYDLNQKRNLSDFSKYYIWFKQTLKAYEHNKAFCSTEDMADLTSFTLDVVYRHHFAINKFYVPHFLEGELPDLKKSILFVSRTAGSLSKAKMWKSYYDNLMHFQPRIGAPSVTAQIDAIEFPSLSHHSVFLSLCLSNLEALAKERSVHSAMVMDI